MDLQQDSADLTNALELVLQIHDLAEKLGSQIEAQVAHLPEEYRRIILTVVAQRIMPK